MSVDEEGNFLEVVIGSWADGYPHGFCLHRKPDGSEYEGLFRRGKREGFGKEVLKDGSWNEGEWEKG